ncbi:MAG: hypothetical protein AB7K63_16260 [Vicinamibacterales bacterium]
MIGRLAIRSLTAHPIRSAVLGAGFGAGVGVMAILLGVAEIVLDQATSPALIGGGDVVIRMAPQVPARMVLSGTLQADALRERLTLAAPWHTETLFLVRDDGSTVEVDARGGIPSLERELGDVETAGIASWQDTDEDRAWTNSTPEEALRQIDRFHDIPNAPDWADSWAEWLYFNGRTGDARFYLTFLVGPRQSDGRRPAGVRLQLDRNGTVESFSAGATLTDEEIARAPELTIGNNRIDLDGLRYTIDLDLRSASGRSLDGRLEIEGVPGRLVPPIEIMGARGWKTGYVVPVMSGSLDGELDVDGDEISFDGGAGYHDHNWGFWEGVSWQWGQVQQGELSFLYGRVYPPAEAADPQRIPGFIGALGPDGPLGYATNVTIIEQDDEQGRPRTIRVVGRGQGVNLNLEFSVGSTVTTRMEQGPLGSGLLSGINFLQMRGTYRVTGTAGTQRFDFSAPGSAETFRGERQSGRD